MATQTKQGVKKVQGEVTVRQSAMAEAADNGSMVSEMTAEDVLVMVDAKLRSAYEEYLSSPQEEIAEPLNWWDLFAVGPIQLGAQLTPPGGFGGPLLPNQIIRSGEKAFVATIVLLSTSFPPTGPSAAEILSSFALPYEIEYGTGELKRWQPGPANLQHVSNGNFTPGVPWAIDIFDFVCHDEGLYEMNISARIFGCDRNYAPPFAGYATRVVDIDRDLFGTGPRVKTEQSIRFQCYK